jgi:hypothetical protein
LHDDDDGEKEKLRDSISNEIDDCEKWHEENGSLHKQIG